MFRNLRSTVQELVLPNLFQVHMLFIYMILKQHSFGKYIFHIISSSTTHRNGKGIMVLDKIVRMKAGCSFIVYVEIFVFKHALKTKVKTFHKPSRQSSVCRASVLSQLVRLVCFILDLSPH